MRMVSLLITLLILGFVIVQMLGGQKSEEKVEATQARIAEDKARQVEAIVLQSAQRQDRQLNAAGGGAGLNNLSQQIQSGQQVQGVQQALAQPQSDNGNGQSQ